MLDSRHAPRYLRWFDGIALLGGGTTLIVLMLMLAPASRTQQKKPEASSQRSRADEVKVLVGALSSQDDESWRQPPHQTTP